MPTHNLTPNQYEQLGDVRLAILDVDDTIAFPQDAPAFYRRYGDAVVDAVAAYYDVPPEQALDIVSHYRQYFGGGEQSLLRGDVHEHFPEVLPKDPDTTTLYDLMSQIDPRGQFAEQPAIRRGIADLRSSGIRVVALTSSPDLVSKAILQESGYDPAHDFDDLVTFERETGPLKKLRQRSIFTEIAAQYGIAPKHVISIGDSLSQDIEPALRAGMLACLVADRSPDTYEGLRADHTVDIIHALQVAIERKKTESLVDYNDSKPRILAEFGEGPTVITFNVGTHGDEIMPVRAVQEIIDELSRTSLLRPGAVRFTISNVPALRIGQRFIERDLNRIYPGTQDDSSEDRTARAVLPLMEGSERTIDLHSSFQSPPFVVLSHRDESHLELAEQSGVDRIVLFESTGGDGPMINFTQCGVGIEIGPHAEKQSAANGQRVIRRYLQGLGLIENDANTEMSPPSYFEIVGRLSKAEGQAIALEQPIVDFVPLIVDGEEYFPVLTHPNRPYADVYTYLAKARYRTEIVDSY